MSPKPLDWDRWRTIRTYVRRETRMTPAQKRALEMLLPLYGLDLTQPLDPQTVFGRVAPLVMEIGMGDGEHMLWQAQRHTEKDFIGVEVYRPGVGKFLRALHQAGLSNVRVYVADARDVLLRAIPDAALDEVQIFFPDPWPKKRHHKRRLISPPFVALLARKLKPGGVLHLSTDWPDYAQHMLEVLNASGAFVNLSPTGDFHPEAASRRRPTKYERRARAEGRTIYDLLFQRVSTSPWYNGEKTGSSADDPSGPSPGR